jgi:curved DNA-binding protein CbpA
MADQINHGYRVLARQHHPDRGGKPSDMQGLNGAVRWLREQHAADNVPF